MNQNGFRNLQFELSGIGFWLVLFGIIWLLGAIGLGWLVKSFFILVGILLITPVIGFFVLRWWLKKNIVENQCPVCAHQFAALNGSQTRCPNCGEALKIEKGEFLRLTPPGTIDVDAVEVQSKQIQD